MESKNLFEGNNIDKGRNINSYTYWLGNVEKYKKKVVLINWNEKDG